MAGASEDRAITTQAPRVSAVVPCYQEEATLPELHRRLTGACADAVGDAYEIVLIDDGSCDRTWETIAKLSDADPRVVGVKLARNHGHQIALTAGLELCRGDRIFILDADLQDPPELLAPMMAKMDEGFDVVYGQRRERAGETWFKRASAKAFYRLLSRLSDTPIPRDTGDFRLMSRRVLDVLKSMPERQRFVRGMVAWAGFSQVAFPYERDARHAGETNYSLKKMLGLSTDAITGFSIVPLKLASWLGFVFAAIAMGLIVYSLASWLFFSTVSGWTSLIIVFLVLSSVQLLVLGVIGEYLGRLFIEAKQRPVFIVDRVLVGGTEMPPKLRLEEASGSSLA
ncbi:glycosyltransferase family 2 protein [Pseudoruegeria sp. HB172150]|uniref:glycosyltransferase family 2 protein n=1 Tax=Pseudoruegeria sp. HB172150 TaxID=2721164 RepID=UPI001554A4A6|nr:glycosyltransferase family 2 protein [Pseudoruegeria sp. HB172150]